MTAEHAVAIVGAGPTGMTLAGELKLAGVDVVVLERRAAGEDVGARAGGLLPRTLEMLDQRGIVARFTSQGRPSNHFEFAGVPLDMNALPTRHNGILALWQAHVERILLEWLTELGVAVRHGHAVTGLTQDDHGVSLTGDETLRAQYVVACDGGRSAIRKAAGIDFPGTDATTSNLIAEVEFKQEPPWGVVRDARGIRGIGKLEDGRARILVTEREISDAREPTLDDLRAELVAAYGSDFGVHGATRVARFTDATRQAANYRAARVFVAGDAAHVHPPDGGQGIQTGMQDAMNLGWKLAQVVKGHAPEALLDTYHAERHPVAARILRNSKVLVALRRDDDRTRALRQMFAELLGVDAARTLVIAMLAGLDVRYDMPLADGADAHALVGRRMPDVDLATGGGARRAFELLHDARCVLLDFGGARGFDSAAWNNRVTRVEASADAWWELPVCGRVAAPAALLIRPDGYVAWAGGSAQSLLAAIAAWCGPGTQAWRRC